MTTMINQDDETMTTTSMADKTMPIHEGGTVDNELPAAPATATVPDDVYQSQPLPPPEPQINYSGLALVFLAPALGGFLYGYDIGATSFVLSMLRSSRDHELWWYGFPKVQQGLLVSTLALGALLGSHIVLVFLAQSIGRRKEIRIAAALYIVGAMLNVMSGTMLATTGTGQYGVGIGLLTLLCGRVFYGAGVGFVMHGAPTYMAEMSPSHVRGALVSAKETVIVFGIVVGMLMGDLLSDYPDNWTDLYAFSILGAVPMLLLTFKIPRSKRWLLMKGYNEEAKESMQFVYKGNIEDEFDRMAETIGSLCCRNDATVDDGVDVDDDMSNTSFFSKVDKDGDLAIPSASGSNNNNYNSEYSSAQKSPTIVETVDTTKLSFWSPQYRKVMMIGITLLIAQQFSGQPSVLAYSRVLFEAAGWQGHASVVTVVIMGITSIGTVALVDRVGRKILLAAGCAIMALALGALTYGFWGWDDDDKNDLSTFKKHLILASMFVYIAGYQVGYGPITWTLLSEIYPSEIRGTAMALSVEINFLSKFLCQLFFPIIQDVLGWGCTFIMFGCIVVISFFFILLKVPETMGKSLEEIQIQLCVTEDNKNNEKVKPMDYSEQSTSTSTSTSSKQQLSSPLLDQRVAAGLTPIV